MNDLIDELWGLYNLMDSGEGKDLLHKLLCRLDHKRIYVENLDKQIEKYTELKKEVEVLYRDRYEEKDFRRIALELDAHYYEKIRKLREERVQVMDL